MTTETAILLTNAAEHLVGSSGFDPRDALIDFGWPVNALYLYVYVNVGIVMFIWLLRHCHPDARMRHLRRALLAEGVLFAGAAVWAALLLHRLHIASQNAGETAIRRAFAYAAFVQAREGFVAPALLSGVVGLGVTYLLWRAARKSLGQRTKT